MNARLIKIFCAIALTATLAACGGGDGDTAGNTPPPPPVVPPPPPPSTGIGAAGGTVTGPSGAQVVIPAGALATSTAIAVAQSSAGAPALPAGVTSFGQIFAFTPHGTAFAVPVTITVPFDPALVPAGTTPVLYKTNAAQSAWEVVPGATVSGQLMSGSVSGFSFVTVASPASGVDSSLTRKEWSVWAFDANKFELFENKPLDGATQTGGELKQIFGVGDPLILAPPGQVLPEATMQVFSNPSGGTFWTAAQAPRALGGSVNTGMSILRQTFTFRRKPGGSASLQFILTRGLLEALDSGGAGPGASTCPWLDKVITITEELTDECARQLMQAFMSFSLVAAKMSPDGDPLKTKVFDSIGSLAFLQGQGKTWSFHVDSDTDFIDREAGHERFLDTLWTERNFDSTNSADLRHPLVALKVPFVIDVPLTGNVKDNDVFTIEVEVYTAAINRVQGESYVAAILRDPLDAQGLGVGMEFDGLEQIPVQDFTSGVEQPVACATGPDPAAGTLQFVAPDFRIPERWPGSTVTVERVGDTRGDVSARVEISDGTALAGSDYRSVQNFVHFADGEGGKRSVSIVPVLDDVAEDDETANLKLTIFRGCAALGTQSTATLTILDDDRPPPVIPTFAFGGTVTGLAGSGLVLHANIVDEVRPTADGPFAFPTRLTDGASYTVSVATQPGNPTQICTVSNGSGTIAGADITNILVNCVTPAAIGALDAGFGSQGKVFGSIGGANVLALQGDGKLLALANLSLTRYNADGSIDTSFGSGGQLNIVANGGGLDAMKALAVQPDGKILVAGGSSFPTVFSDDFVVLRFNPDGTADTSFGTGGKVLTDFAGHNDDAKAVLVQPDGKIVVAGNAQLGGSLVTEQDFAVVRYLPDGTLDAAFGIGGKATLDAIQFGGRSNFVNAEALQADGSIVVVGRVFTDNGSGNSDMGVARFLANGSVDQGFGTHGAERIDVATGSVTPISFDGGGWDEALDVLVQPDGRILVGGYTQVGVDFRAALVRLMPAGGTLDFVDFGTNGMVTAASIDKANGIALQADGRIVIAGRSNSDFGIERFTSAGVPDSTFGTSGLLPIDFFGAADNALDVLVQPDGKIVASGIARNGTSNGPALVRVK